MRPCCAFGGNLKVAVGKVPVPGIEIGNSLGPEDVGWEWGNAKNAMDAWAQQATNRLEAWTSGAATS